MHKSNIIGATLILEKYHSDTHMTELYSPTSAWIYVCVCVCVHLCAVYVNLLSSSFHDGICSLSENL